MTDVMELSDDGQAERRIRHAVQGHVQSNGQYVAIILDKRSFERLVELLSIPTKPPRSMNEVSLNATVASGGGMFSLKNIAVTLTID
jgi:hypothetical protein